MPLNVQPPIQPPVFPPPIFQAPIQPPVFQAPVIQPAVQSIIAQPIAQIEPPAPLIAQLEPPITQQFPLSDCYMGRTSKFFIFKYWVGTKTFGHQIIGLTLNSRLRG